MDRHKGRRVLVTGAANGIGWAFRPLQREMKVRLGEVAHVSFLAENRTDVTSTGTASFNVAPDRSGQYFNKIACFCFNAQTLKPGEKREMPVVFFVDPDIVKDPDLKDVKTITLSYTFFPIPKPKPVVTAEGGTGSGS